jgi:Skp family chaperone for outer membrane proteins
MKRLLCLLPLLAAQTLSAAPLKIGIVDMDKVYSLYNKTKTNEAELEKDKAAAREEIEKRAKKFAQLQEELKARAGTARSATQGSAAHKKAMEEFNSKQGELQSLQREAMEFKDRREKMIMDKLKRMREDILSDLHTQVEKESATAGYDLVFNKTGISSSGVEVMLFSKDAIDFTDAVLQAVNKNAPEAPAPAPAPAPKEGADK